MGVEGEGGGLLGGGCDPLATLPVEAAMHVLRLALTPSRSAFISEGAGWVQHDPFAAVKLLLNLPLVRSHLLNLPLVRASCAQILKRAFSPLANARVQLRDI
jgi:hypothetical protein